MYETKMSNRLNHLVELVKPRTFYSIIDGEDFIFNYLKSIKKIKYKPDGEVDLIILIGAVNKLGIDEVINRIKNKIKSGTIIYVVPSNYELREIWKEKLKELGFGEDIETNLEIVKNYLEQDFKYGKEKETLKFKIGRILYYLGFKNLVANYKYTKLDLTMRY